MVQAATAFTVPVETGKESTTFQPSLRTLGTPSSLSLTTTSQIENALRATGVASAVFTQLKKEHSEHTLLDNLSGKNEFAIRAEITPRLQQLFSEQLANPSLRAVMGELLKNEERLGAESAVRDALLRVSLPALKNFLQSLSLSRSEGMAVTVILHEAVRSIVEKNTLALVPAVLRTITSTSNSMRPEPGLESMTISRGTSLRVESYTTRPVTVPKGKLVAFSS